jgi:protein-tyrosine phosphatase
MSAAHGGPGEGERFQQDAAAHDIAVLFVCLGNHCRSPAAHAVADTLSAAVPNVLFDSAGTSRAHVGDLPHPLSAAEGRARGHDVNHRGRQISPDDFARFDLIIAMDDMNTSDLLRMSGRSDQRRGRIHELEPNQIQLLRRWDPYCRPSDLQLADPWGGGREAYVEMYDVIERCMNPLIDHVAELAQRVTQLR